MSRASASGRSREVHGPERASWAPAHRALARLVVAARRRMRLNRMLAVTGPAVIAVGVAALVWVALSRALPLPAPDLVVAGLLALGVLLAVAVAAAVRIPPVWAAWAADRWLDGRDAYATAVELLERPGGAPLAGLALAQVRRSEERAAGFRGFPEGPRVPVRLLSGGAALVLLAVTLGSLPNPQDARRAQEAAERAQVDAQADRLRSEAEQIAANGDTAERAEVAGRLERLAERLDAASREEALEALAREQAVLARDLEGDPATRRTALSGLAQELGRDPLAPGQGVREQLGALAGQLSAGSPDAEDQQALSDRLERLAAALRAEPEVAQALQEAAAAVAAGDGAAAGQAVGQASAAVDEALSGLDGQTARTDATAAVSAAASALRGDGQGQGAGQGQGDGQGQGQGDGQGEGQGAGQGQGQGQGGGAGGGGGSPAGQVSVDDGGARRGSGSGSATGAGDQPDSELDLQTVYAPPQRPQTAGNDLRLGGRPDEDQPEIGAGSVQGDGLRNDALVPYLDVLPEYADRAARTVEQGGYPVRLRGTVQDYFDRLAAPSDPERGAP